MLRTIDIIMIGLLLGGAGFTFKIKRDSELAIARVSELEQQIQAEHDAIDVLKADWGLLSNPKRLEVLVEKYREQLGLDILDPANIGTLSQVPEKIIVPDPLPDTGIAGIIEKDEEITTGTIKKERPQ